MLDFAKYLEDSVYCNDRSVIDYGNWASTNNVTGYGMGYETIKFKNYNLNDELYCKNITDRFSVSNDKAKLKYPVGLVSLPELHLLKKVMPHLLIHQAFILYHHCDISHLLK